MATRLISQWNKVPNRNFSCSCSNGNISVNGCPNFANIRQDKKGSITEKVINCTTSVQVTARIPPNPVQPMVEDLRNDHLVHRSHKECLSHFWIKKKVKVKMPY